MNISNCVSTYKKQIFAFFMFDFNTKQSHEITFFLDGNKCLQFTYNNKTNRCGEFILNEYPNQNQSC